MSAPDKPTTSPPIETLREAIDGVDTQLLSLLNDRARLVKEVGKVKEKLAQPFFVPHREQQILDRLRGLNTGPFPQDALRPVFSEIISACLSLEHPLKVTYLGPEATFTHMAARERFGLSARYLPAATITAAFADVEKGLADIGVVPIENSTEGVVSSTLDMFIDSDLRISGEILLDVNQCLLSRSGDVAGIQKIYSHPQALAQCRQWLATHVPSVALIEVASTALAARLAKDDHVAGAIASEMAGALYDLKLVRARIQDEARNVTRFLIIGHKDAKQSGRDRTSIMFSVKDSPGILYEVLAPFASRKINLSRIESRPSRKRAWDYLFFIDIEGHLAEPLISEAIEELRAHCEVVKVLGSFPRGSLS